MSAIQPVRADNIQTFVVAAPTAHSGWRRQRARPAKRDQALAAFEKEARMTPQQRIRRDVLKGMASPGNRWRR